MPKLIMYKDPNNPKSVDKPYWDYGTHLEPLETPGEFVTDDAQKSKVEKVPRNPASTVLGIKDAPKGVGLYENGPLPNLLPAALDAVMNLPHSIGEKASAVGDWWKNTIEKPQPVDLPSAINTLLDSTKETGGRNWLEAGKGLVHGTLMDAMNVREDPASAAMAASQFMVPGAAEELPVALRGVAAANEEGYLNSALRRVLGKAQQPFHIPELTPNPMDLKEYTKWRIHNTGESPSLPELGRTETFAKEFNRTNAGREKVVSGNQAIQAHMDYEAARGGGLPAIVAGKFNDLMSGKLPLGAAEVAAFNRIDPERVTGRIYRHILENVPNKNGNLDPDALIKYLQKSGNTIKAIAPPGTATALQNIAFNRKKLAAAGDLSNAAMDFTKEGAIRFLWRMTTRGTLSAPPMQVASAVGGALKTPIAKMFNTEVMSEGVAKLLANPEGKWLLTRLSGMKATDPALPGALKKLAIVSGKLGIPLSNVHAED